MASLTRAGTRGNFRLTQWNLWETCNALDSNRRLERRESCAVWADGHQCAGFQFRAGRPEGTDDDLASSRRPHIFDPYLNYAWPSAPLDRQKGAKIKIVSEDYESACDRVFQDVAIRRGYLADIAPMSVSNPDRLGTLTPPRAQPYVDLRLLCGW